MGIVFTATIGWRTTGENNITRQKMDNQQAPDNRAVIAIRKIKLKEGVSAETFERFAVKLANDEYGKLPGVKFYFGKGERGDEPKSYIYFMEFDSKSTRDYYAPAEDDNAKRSADAAKMVDEFFNKMYADFNKLAEVMTPSGKKGFVDYIITK